MKWTYTVCAGDTILCLCFAYPLIYFLYFKEIFFTSYYFLLVRKKKFSTKSCLKKKYVQKIIDYIIFEIFLNSFLLVSCIST